MTPSSATINTLTEQLSRVTEALEKTTQEKKKRKEEQKLNDASSFKICPYRRAIFWMAFAIQAGVWLMRPPLAHLSSYGLLVFLFAFSYIGASILGDFLVYRVFKKKDSKKADLFILEKKYHLSPDELDAYIQKLIQLRLIAGSVAGVVFGLILLSVFPWYSGLSLYFVWLSYEGITLIGMIWLRIKGSVKTPRKFFLVEWMKKHPRLENDFMDEMPIKSEASVIDYSCPSIPNYGCPGYNSLGVYTGSSTAIGGVSD